MALPDVGMPLPISFASVEFGQVINMKMLKIGRSSFAYVDDEDYDRLNEFTWYVGYMNGKQKFAYTRDIIDGRVRNISLHSMVMNVSNVRISHRNGDKLDCRKENMLLGVMNKPNVTGYRGVTYDPILDRFRAHLQAEGIDKWSGRRYHTAQEAARAYDEMALAYLGDEAILNFPFSRNDDGIEEIQDSES